MKNMINKIILKAGAMVVLAFSSCGGHQKKHNHIQRIVIGTDTVFVDNNGIVVDKNNVERNEVFKKN